jgi:pilus assembly protein CpaC
MNFSYRFRKYNYQIIFAGLLFVSLAAGSAAPENSIGLTVYIGQSQVIEFEQPIKRVAISNPEVAYANVVSPHQILVDGKSAGVTSLVIWPESGNYLKYRLHVCNEAFRDQVMLQMRFMEINKSALKTFGSDFLIQKMKIGSEHVDVGSYGGKVSEPSIPLALGNSVDMFFSVTSQNITTIIKALYEDNLLSILAAPNLSAVSGEEASFLAGGEFPIPIVSGTMGMQTVTIQFKEYGVGLKFIPTVLDSQVVNIKVAAEVSHLDFENGILISGFRIPSLITRKAETTVELKEGQFLILGGLLSDDVSQIISKIPILGQIPILGKLFSSKRYQKSESELLVTLSPKIIHEMSREEISGAYLNTANP